MEPLTKVYLFGSLRKKLGNFCDHPVQLGLKTATPLEEILSSLKIATDMVELAMINYRAVHKDSTIRPGDRLSLFPKEYPIFADWGDLRF